MSDNAPQEGFDNFYSICGFLGGCVFAIALLPQLWQAYRTKSTGDLSYFWQATYMLGLAGLSIYCIGYSLWPVLGPGVADFFFMGVLTWMKFYYDNMYKRPPAEVKEIDVEGHTKQDAEGSKEEVAPLGASSPTPAHGISSPPSARAAPKAEATVLWEEPFKSPLSIFDKVVNGGKEESQDDEVFLDGDMSGTALVRKGDDQVNVTN